MFDNLRAEMKRYSLTNADVAKILNISVNAVSFKLNGKTSFTIHEFVKLADKFNVSLDYLAERNSIKGVI